MKPAALLFAILLAFSATRWASPPLALALGIAFGLLFVHPFRAASARFSKLLLQVSVVGLGFGMNLPEVLRAGASGIVYTAATIAFALACGFAIGRLVQVDRRSGYLISVGTAICGGSAIAAVAPLTGASDEQISSSLGTVFVLNAVALLLFPAIGLALGMEQREFGLWAALAIHDTSSVVGAGAEYGAAALAVATTVKLARALWIVPLAFGTALFVRSGTSIRWPWFILLFLAAAFASSALPVAAPLWSALSQLARIGLTVTLFLIGSGISRASLRAVGLRPFVLGLLLWIVVAAASLALVESGIVAF